MLILTRENVIGMPDFDDQHKKIVQAATVLLSEIKSNAKTGNRASSAAAYSAMEEMFLMHFKSEEAAMSSVKYPLFYKHQVEHVTIVRDIAKTKNRFLIFGYSVRLPFDKACAEARGIVQDWVGRHIEVSDKPMSVFLLEIGF